MTTAEAVEYDQIKALIRQWRKEDWDKESFTAKVLALELKKLSWSGDWRTSVDDILNGDWYQLPEEFFSLDCPPELDTDDWREAFVYAVDPDPCPPTAQFDIQRFNRSDVAEVIAKVEGENDEANWLILGRLRCGLYFYLSAGCDFTGWDCRAWGECQVAETLDDLIRFGVDEADRVRLGLKLE